MIMQCNMMGLRVVVGGSGGAGNDISLAARFGGKHSIVRGTDSRKGFLT